MKPLLCLLLALVVPALCRGEGVSLADSPDWQTLPQTQGDMFLKQIDKSRVLSQEQKDLIIDHFNEQTLRLIDASKYSGGGSAVTIVSSPGTEIKKNFYQSDVTEVIQGMPSIAPTVTNRQPASVGLLPGESFDFQLNVAGHLMFGLSYVVFAKREIYVITFYRLNALTRTDPIVTSYLSRIKIDPAVAPASSDFFGGFTPASLDHYRLGSFTGTDLLVLGVAAVLLALIAKFVPGR